MVRPLEARLFDVSQPKLALLPNKPIFLNAEGYKRQTALLELRRQ